MQIRTNTLRYIGRIVLQYMLILLPVQRTEFYIFNILVLNQIIRVFVLILNLLEGVFESVSSCIRRKLQLFAIIREVLCDYKKQVYYMLDLIQISFPFFLDQGSLYANQHLFECRPNITHVITKTIVYN